MNPFVILAGCHIIWGSLLCDPDQYRREVMPFAGRGPQPDTRPPSATGAIVSANYLMGACVSPERVRQAGCAGFVSGVIDSYSDQRLFCIGGLDHWDVERNVIEYLKRVPMQGLTATGMVLEALKAGWPCR